MLPARIGPYALVSVLGRGGMGVVYRARSPEGLDVAVKVLLHDDPERRARFERERRLIAQLGVEEGFVPLLDSGATDSPYIVMPFVTGGTLRDRLRQGTLGIEETLDLGFQLAQALGRAHSLGIIHRDLKPENILFTERGRALVADLGLAKHYDRNVSGASESAALSKSGALLGTPGYMPPEQMADARAAGPQADVFALGAILHECLTGRSTFGGENLLDIVRRAAVSERSSLAKVRPETPAALVAAIDRALEVDPARRFADAVTLARALDAARTGGRSRGGGRRLAFAGLVALLALGGLGAVGAVVLGRRGAAPAPPVPSASSKPAQPVRPGLLRPLSPGRSPQDVAGLLEDARSAYAAGDHETAFAYATRAVALEPREPNAWYILGVVRSERGDAPGAVAALTHALDLTGPHEALLASRALAHARAGADDAAIDDYARSLALDPSPKHLWLERANALARRERFAEVLSDAERALALDPESADAWFLRGLARDHLGDVERATTDYEKALALAPPDETASRVRRAFAQLRARRSKALVTEALEAYNGGEYARAIAVTTSAIAIEPRDAGAYVTRAVVRLALKDHAGAIADLDAALLIDPKFGAAHSNRAIARHRLGDVAGAVDDYGRAIALSPSLSQPYFNRGRLLRDLGDAAGAAADFKRWLELVPRDPSAESVRKLVAELEKAAREKAAREKAPGGR